MKKVFILIVMVLMMPVIVLAKDYEITDHIIDMEMEIAGGLKVTEVFVVNGTTDFIPRTLNYYSFGEKFWDGKQKVDFEGNEFYNAYSISEFKYSVFKYNEKLDINKLDRDVVEYYDEYNLKSPKNKSYMFTDNEKGIVNLKLFYPVKNERVVFYIKYIIANAIVKHNDVMEMNYTFKNLDKCNAKNTIMRLITPYPIEEADQEVSKLYVHGNQSGKFGLIQNEESKVIYGLYGTFKEVDNVNFRVTVPHKYVGIDVYLNHSGVDGLQKIIKVENSRNQLTNRNNKIKDIMLYVILGLMGIYVIGSVLFLKFTDIKIFILYLALGLVLIGCTIIFFKLTYWYSWFSILVPVIIYLLKKCILPKKVKKNKKK